jgi:large subunit ribosomal protein L5
MPKESFDGRGNYSLGLQEQTIFPEIDYEQVDKVRGLEITFVTSADNNEHAFALLKHLGLPFAKEGKEKG